MCGIAGQIKLNGKPVLLADIIRMGSYLRERGPDAEGVWITENVGFFHSRLSIIDLSEGGKQPMADVSGQLVISYNGEIYNFLRLKKELLKAGLVFRTRTDTEVILNGYLQWGMEGLLGRLDGMFAFVLYDQHKRKFYAARDRFGKKPLYYSYREGDSFCFSSDIRSLWATDKNLSVDVCSVDYYLSELSVPQPRTIWREINQVSPGAYLTGDEQGRFSEKKYWSLSFSDVEKMDEQETVSETERLLRAAVQKRTVGDVPVCSFLSGGIDSGLVVAFLAQSSPTPVRTFSVGFTYEAYNELDNARKLAKRYSTDHTEIIVEADVNELLPRLIDSFGEPFADSSNIPVSLISKEIAGHFKVAFSGDGGDELFGGYHEYGWTFALDEFRKRYSTDCPFPILYANKLAYRLRLTGTNYGHLMEYGKMPGWRKLYREMGFSPEEKNILYTCEFKELRKKDYVKYYLGMHWEKCAADNVTNTLFGASFRTRLLNDYLVKIDRGGMMNSLEIRSPYLDQDLALFSARIPHTIKLKNGTEKYLLKLLAKKYMDPGIFSRKKQGFGIPLKEWISGPFKHWIADILFSDTFRNRKIFNIKFVKHIADKHFAGKADHSHRIWAMVNLELWYRKFVDR